MYGTMKNKMVQCCMKREERAEKKSKRQVG
jgi:hypothetical protein